MDPSGRPSCSQWDFESNDARYPTEGWTSDPGGRAAGELAIYGSLYLSSAQSVQGTHSLAFPVTVPDAARGFAAIRVPLCSSGSAIDLTGKSIAYAVRFVTAADSPQLFDGAQSYATLYQSSTMISPGLAGNGRADVALGDSPWIQRSGDIGINFGVANASFTHVGLFFLFQNAWKGTIYVDAFRVF